jgi:hypothetical protein
MFYIFFMTMTCSTSHCLVTVLGIYGINIYVCMYVLPLRTVRWRRGGGMVWQEAALPMLCYIVPLATTRDIPNVWPQPCRLHSDDQTACGVIILRFHGVTKPLEVFIRGLRCSVLRSFKNHGLPI